MNYAKLSYILASMKPKTIRTLRGLQRLLEARNRRAAKLRKRPYLLKAALVGYLEQFERLQTISDPQERYDQFRQAASLEAELERVNGSLTKQQQTSLAQRNRAQKPRTRVTSDGVLLRQLIRDVISPNPWDRRAKSYWAPFLERLGAMNLKPITFTSPHDRSGELVEYGPSGRRRQLSLRRFENIVSSIRQRRPTENDAGRLS